MKTIYCFATILPAFLVACKPQQHPSETDQAPKLVSYFKAMPLADTLHLEVNVNGEPEAPADTIPSNLFFAALDTAWLKEIEHVAAPGEALVYAKGHFPIAKEYEGLLVEVHQNWFKHQSLLVFDQQRQAFTDRQTVAEWYGGESGQILTGSWLFDYDGDGNKDLVQREIEHWMKMDEQGEPIESTQESGQLMLFKNGRFTPSSQVDSASLTNRFKIKTVW
ncbi:MAG: hypothetical protein IT258_04345 [Saprospiraceae bacterium]|nr:hypothetical protein [Saprospiraceae bacterium]